MTARTFNPHARRRTRRVLMQAIYAWQHTDAEFADLLKQFAASEQMRKGDKSYLAECLRGIVRGADALDPLFEPYLDRRIEQLDGVERAILRAGTFELKERLDVPAPVAINEWVEIAKTFGATESFRYVNGVLDRVARDLRGAELAAAGTPAPATD